MIAPSALAARVSRHGSAMARPVYLQQRTYLVTAGMAVECHFRAHALQQTAASLFNRHSIGLDPGRCYDVRPFLCLGTPEFGEIQGRTDFRLGIELGEARLQLGRT